MEEENEQVTVKQVAIKWGLILGIISIVYFLIVYFGGFMGQSWADWGGIIFSIIIIYLAQKEYLAQGNGYMSYGQGLGLGTLVATVSSVISSAFAFIYAKFINQGYIEELLDISRAGMEESGQSEDNIDAGMAMVEKFMNAEMMLIMGILFGVFFGFIVALIVSAITKNNDPSLEV